MFSSVTSWLGVGEKPSDTQTNQQEEDKENTSEKETVDKNQPSETKSTNTKEESTENKEKDLSLDEAKQALEDVSAKAINTAKEWGSYLFSVSKAAGKSVADHAKQISKSVEEKTFLGDFSKEQDRFVSEKEEKVKRSEAAVPPWVGYNEEEAMKKQILALSTDKRNFLRNPPSGVQFQFQFDLMFPVATATLQEDKNLEKMRFELVPKQIKEETFWRNYFYRVSLIKQSTQMSTLAQETGSEGRSSNGSRRSSSGSLDKDHPSLQGRQSTAKEEEFTAGSPPNENEFVSDTFQDNQISEEDLRKEMQLLGVEGETDKDSKDKDEDTEDIPPWERELQQELQDYEMVNEGADLDDADIENEILQEIEQETKTL